MSVCLCVLRSQFWIEFNESARSFGARIFRWSLLGGQNPITLSTIYLQFSPLLLHFQQDGTNTALRISEMRQDSMLLLWNIRAFAWCQNQWPWRVGFTRRKRACTFIWLPYNSQNVKRIPQIQLCGSLKPPLRLDASHRSLLCYKVVFGLVDIDTAKFVELS